MFYFYTLNKNISFLWRLCGAEVTLRIPSWVFRVQIPQYQILFYQLIDNLDNWNDTLLVTFVNLAHDTIFLLGNLMNEGIRKTTESCSAE